MCIGSRKGIKSHKHHFSLRNPNHVLKLSRSARKQWKDKVGSDIGLRNLKLYMENISIREENEKLRKKANLLHQENLALVSEFQKKFSGNKSDVSIKSQFKLIHKE